ncbi:MAG: very short patch repair endonuclease [Tannerellaceae bacterium]|nr:very short patch repair endonuclease [Tannerellaceae bacterium]
MDIWDKKKRSKVMSNIRSKNTKPEITLRKELYKIGFRYRINYKKLPGKPDIVFPKYKTAIFVNGCFWHGHGPCSDTHIPKTNSTYWQDKIDRNKQRDKENIEKLESLGWKVMTVWDCEIQKKEKLDLLIKEIESILYQELPLQNMSIKIYENINEAITCVKEEIIVYNHNKKGSQ